MLILSIFTVGCLLISFLIDSRKTLNGVRKGLKMFINLFPALLLMLSLVSVALFLIPEETLIKYMGEGSGLKGWLTSAMLGSIALIPGFIAYPLCGILVKSGVAYSTIAVFITTLMMVGILTMPIEVRFFGWKTTVIRNILSFIGAIVIGLIMMLLL